jgi:alkylated DNA repair dioxygenase AlkB
MRRRYPWSERVFGYTIPFVTAPLQRSLLGADDGEPTVDRTVPFERIQLDDTAWVDVARGWMQGTMTLFDQLVSDVPWSQGRRFLYDQWRDDPRLSKFYKDDAAVPHPVLRIARKVVESKYRVPVSGPGLNYYRDGSDSVAPHADRELRHLDDTLIAILTLGSTRPFTISPKAARNAREGAVTPTIDVRPAAGDLLVMGGSAQRGWLHGVPKVAGGGPRISVTWRWTSKRGRPEQGGNWGDPRHYGDRRK